MIVIKCTVFYVAIYERKIIVLVSHEFKTKRVGRVCLFTGLAKNTTGPKCTYP